MTFSTLVLAVVALSLAYVIIFFCPNVAEMYELEKPRERWAIVRSALSRTLTQASLVGGALFASAFGVLGAPPSTFIYFRF